MENVRSEKGRKTGGPHPQFFPPRPSITTHRNVKCDQNNDNRAKLLLDLS